jgi:hypothetical protein
MNAVILRPSGDRDFAATPLFLLTSFKIPRSLLQGIFDCEELFDSYILSLTFTSLWLVYPPLADRSLDGLGRGIRSL